jgi:hypothetical protein
MLEGRRCSVSANVNVWRLQRLLRGKNLRSLNSAVRLSHSHFTFRICAASHELSSTQDACKRSELAPECVLLLTAVAFEALQTLYTRQSSRTLISSNSVLRKGSVQEPSVHSTVLTLVTDRHKVLRASDIALLNTHLAAAYGWSWLRTWRYASRGPVVSTPASYSARVGGGGSSGFTARPGDWLRTEVSVVTISPCSRQP